MSISKEILSGSTDGLGIKITETTYPGNTIHTAHETSKDEIWIWAYNDNAEDVELTIDFGGDGDEYDDPDCLIVQTITAQSGLYLCVPGLPLTNEKVIRAFAGSANVIVLYGYANRIS